MTAIGVEGYRINNAVTPRAPAPTDEIVTSTPRMAPVRIVSHAALRGEIAAMTGSMIARNCFRKINESAVSNSMIPNVIEIMVLVVALVRSIWAMTYIVSRVAGVLPVARRRVMRQSIVWFRPCTHVPAIFVIEAYNRSVPTAVAG
jgi:hypothetical protein